jgi:hypothetical protein
MACEEFEVTTEEVNNYIDHTLLTKLTLEVKTMNLINHDDDLKCVNLVTSPVSSLR